MSRIFKKSIVCLGCVCILALVLHNLAQAENEPKRIDVMFTHDTHSHLESFTTLIDGKTQEIGGYAKLKTLIDEQKEKNPDTLVVDGGDYSMGTLVQTVFEKEAAELRMLGEISVDATTFGNHEFDYRSQGLANMLITAAESGDPVPELLVSNIDWETMESAGLTEEQQLLKDALNKYGVKEYTTIQKGDVKIALFGIFGEDCLECAPTCALQFENASAAAKRIVDKIEKNEADVDMIVCLSHGGTWEEKEKSEDEILAKNVPEIDLIISGHTHSILEEPIRQGDTYIVSCGEYGKNIGSLSMTEQKDGVWKMESYEIIPVTSDIEEDAQAREKIKQFIETINSGYLADFGYVREQVLATNDIKFSTVDELADVHTEHNLGSIIADAYSYAVGDEVDVSIVPAGTVRDTYAEGDITVEKVFNSFSLGIGPDGVPGYPLVKTYLSGEELKVIAEIDASISDFMTTARLYTNGLQFCFNPNRLILNRVTDCYLTDDTGNHIEIENDKLYCVVSDLYSAQMLGAVTDMSFGLLSIVPKFEDGSVVKDYEDLIITNDGKELKAWAAIAAYMESFEDTDGDGIGNIPEEYSSNQGRKVVDDSKKLLDLIKNPNKYAAMIIGVVLVIILVVVVIVTVVMKKIKKMKKYKKVS